MIKIVKCKTEQEIDKAIIMREEKGMTLLSIQKVYADLTGHNLLNIMNKPSNAPIGEQYYELIFRS